MSMKALFFLALVNALACTWANPAHTQALGHGAPTIIGTWRGKTAFHRGDSDSISYTLVFQPSAVGYWASNKRYPFTYSFIDPNCLQLSTGGKPPFYLIEFLTTDTFHILPYPTEVDAWMESAIFRRQPPKLSTP